LKRYIGNCEFLSKLILIDRTNENNPNVVESMYEAVPYRTYQPKIGCYFDQSESVSKGLNQLEGEAKE